MTTIAYRDGVLAADSMLSDNATLVGSFTKIRPVGDVGFLALAGQIGPNFKIMIDWLSKWPVIDEAPKCLADGDVSGIFALESGRVFQLVRGSPYEISAPFFADGTGRFIALGAMAMGATAEQAVDVAIHYDHHSGGTTQTVRVGS